MKNKRMLAGPYLFWSVSFVVIPLLVIVYYAFTSDEGTFTFSNLAQITTPENLKALGMSLLLSFLSTLICLVLAYPLAMILSQKQVNQTSFIVLIFILPMWMNFLLRTLAWQTLLEKTVSSTVYLDFCICRHLRSSIHRMPLFSVWFITSCHLWCFRSTMFLSRLTET